MEDIMGLTPIQRYRIRQYLDRVRKRKEYEKSLKNKAKFFSVLKSIGKVGFIVFLIKGLLWLLLIYYGVQIF